MNPYRLIRQMNRSPTNRSAIRGLYAIIDTGIIAGCAIGRMAELAILGGAGVIQYRDKSGDRDRRMRECLRLAKLCRHYHIPFIVNDDPVLAVRCGADGVHIGREDPDIHASRRHMGKQAIVGVSCYNQLQRALEAQSQGADYVAFGSFYSSPTKPRAVPADITLLHAAKKELHIPMVAIGGITPENGAALVAEGAHAVAVIDGVFNQVDIRAAADRYSQLFATTDKIQHS